MTLGASMDDPFAAPAGSRTYYRFHNATQPPPPPPTAASIPGGYRQDFNTESYDQIVENSFRSPRVAPLSTFSIDVDTASYSNLRRMILQDQTPPADAIRIEELINYFPYDYPEPQAITDIPEKITPDNLPEFLEHPVAIETEVGPAPWNLENRLLRIALKGFEIDWDQRPPANLVFLLDVSGSMSAQNKLPLVKESLQLLVNRLNENDRVAVVVYAGASGLILPSTTANNTKTILHALDNLQAGGSTNAGAGIDLAYQIAQENFIEDGVNRVILCTDGDFNIGTTDKGSLVEKAEGYADEDIYLTILGFGMGNYKDDMLEALTNAADGNYAYIDGPQEARRLFLQAASGSMITIAKDVKIQVEFNPAVVKAYRLIGYENRLLNAEDFNDDTKDAGELGTGQTVTALYEIALPSADIKLPEVDDLKYQTSTATEDTMGSENWTGQEVATVKLRYKWPKEDNSNRMEIPAILPPEIDFSSMGEDYRLTAALATWGMLLRGSEFTDVDDWSIVEEVADDQLSSPKTTSLRSEWSGLVEKSKHLSQQEDSKASPSE
ncbi:vWA domain-containing protein [Puniceicoccus vermicola]|uniref:VWA domain-containing protein n=1 Tax=Puniceicoccus vermicola TaxID=388746 RepID=A0A7X1B012_9BACT|nr:VWA domain-containing protein [Puniceicoccus vermicola]MBC2603131.1 VWA domain-containing protein [Puniceicoccus vermicola]